MIHRFATFETAALFVTMKRDQGYFAEVLHANAGHLWGPVASMGFSVITSDLAAEEDDEVPELSLTIPSLPTELGTVLGYAVISTVSAMLLLMLMQLLVHLAESPIVRFAAALVWMVLAALIVVFFSALGWFLSEATRICRDPEHRLYGLVRFVCTSIAVLLLGMQSGAIGWLLYLLAMIHFLHYGPGGSR